MYNAELIKHLDAVADRYFMSGDSIRSRTFRVAARNIELLYFEIDSTNIDAISFKGIGNSVKDLIVEFIQTGTSKRFSLLEKQHPPLAALKLLQLPNMDITTLNHLWRTSGSLPTLFIPPHDSIIPLESPPFGLLGDAVVHTSFGLGSMTNQQLITGLLERGDKHIFIADHNSSPNAPGGGLSEQLFNLQRQEFKQLQIENNVRIWQGIVVDLDLNGKLIGSMKNIELAEFVIIKILTQPLVNVTSRLLAAITQLPHKSLFIDCINHNSHLLNINDLQQIAAKTTILISHSSMQIAELLKRCNFPRLAFGTYSQSLEDTDKLLALLALIDQANLNTSNIVNFLPRPFLETSNHTSFAGVRLASSSPTSNSNQHQDPFKKIEATLTRINELRFKNLKIPKKGDVIK